jgi:ABC-type lipoprotein release transport system permease subunit
VSAVWYRARAELRSRLLAVIALAVIVGVIGGVVIAAAAGARRTQTAYPRLLQASNALDVVTDVAARDPAVGRQLQQQIEQLPQVQAYSHVELAMGELRIPGRAKPGQVFPIVSPDGRFGTTINRFKILEGRTVDASATDEIVPSFAVADDLGLYVGQTVRLVFGGLLQGPTPPGFKPPSPVALHVVGIGAAPGMFQPLAGGYLPGVLVSRGFYQAHHDFIQRDDWSTAIVLRRGLADLHPYLLAVKRIKDHLPPRSHISFAFNQFRQTAGVLEATHTQAISFWVLAALVAIAGVAIFGQAMARQTFLESVEYPTLRSLGVSPSQLFALGMIRAVFTGLVGAGIAVAVAFALSPLTPTGVARIAEPHPGFAFDGMAIGIGAAGIVLAVVLFGAIPAWRAAVSAGTALGAAELPGSQRPSAIAALIGRAWRSPSSTAGVRMALEPGRGRTAVPVRTTMFGAAISLFALAAALSFGASLDRLVTTPGLSGWNWDAMLFCCAGGHGSRPETLGKQLVATLDGDPRVQGYALGQIDTIGVGDVKGVTGLGMESRKGSVTPALVEGRLPVGPDEILLGTSTMQKAGVGIGDTVPVSGQAGTFQMTVVGRVAMPPVFFSFTGPGQGAATSLTGFERLQGRNEPPDVGGFFLRLTPGTNLQDYIAGLKQKVSGIFVVPQPPSGQLSNLRGITNVPLVLAGIVALMAAATLAHTLITSIRRRRLDFAIMKTLGFVRGQVSAAVAWQASTLAAVAVLVGLPLGIISGRWGWNLLADRLGVVPDAVVPVLAILIAVPVTIVVANLIAVLPGRIAARLKAAPVLRSE